MKIRCKKENNLNILLFIRIIVHVIHHIDTYINTYISLLIVLEKLTNDLNCLKRAGVA